MIPLRTALAVPLLLAGCSDPGAPPAARNESDAPAALPSPAASAMVPAAEPDPAASPPIAVEPGNAVSETVGGDGSQISLAPLQPGDVEGLEGEFACSFAERSQGPALLIARADVGKGARAFAAVRNAGVRETLAATAGGGFSALEKGVVLGGKGLTIRITPGTRVTTGDESVARRATLLVERGDGAERRFRGLWTCGP